MTRAAAILATSPDLLQDQHELKKQIDKKLVSYLRVLPFRVGASYRLTDSLSRAIRHKSSAAAVGLLLTKDALTSLTPVQIERLYDEIPGAIEDKLLRREMVTRLTWCLKERGKLQALKLAAGKLNDTSLMHWVVKNHPKWDMTQLRDWGLKEAVRFGNVSAACIVLGGYVCPPVHSKIQFEVACIALSVVLSVSGGFILWQLNLHMSRSDSSGSSLAELARHVDKGQQP